LGQFRQILHITHKLGEEKPPGFWVTSFCYFWGKNSPNSPCHKIAKIKNPGFGQFVWGILKKKWPKVSISQN